MAEHIAQGRDAVLDAMAVAETEFLPPREKKQ